MKDERCGQEGRTGKEGVICACAFTLTSPGLTDCPGRQKKKEKIKGCDARLCDRVASPLRIGRTDGCSGYAEDSWVF